MIFEEIGGTTIRLIWRWFRTFSNVVVAQNLYLFNIENFFLYADPFPPLWPICCQNDFETKYGRHFCILYILKLSSEFKLNETPAVSDTSPQLSVHINCGFSSSGTLSILVQIKWFFSRSFVPTKQWTEKIANWKLE